jgi:hypothetical protein
VTGTYAKNTDVPSSRSREEIERTLVRYGAEQFATGWDGQVASVMFIIHNRRVRFMLPLPDRNAAEFRLTPSTRRPRSTTEAANAYEQAVKQKWRALALVIKAKLEAVESGIVTFEAEFGMHMLLPDGRTVAEVVSPAIEEAYQTGQTPPLLGGFGRPALPAGSSRDG